ncbi:MULTISPECIES: mechanosensitive ion channel domain-containing protein [Acidithiobacillus]|uniref:Small-conductance mechanosensitive channel n=4 Tax=Acidithiobacillus caldus TaxID=33059 RepID=F9ZQG1_ACICS|nr:MULTISPECIES: mechanosensitive ion channel domain-containing protein [Acidithiobacillus]AEK58378.1 small-conductance mechanosensitive channel [Acidithiobacillus caldus SM-1]AIA55346.1 Small-conductance mechanosensitive channel [Acidithiobacillus caldus ATCC 51756]AUW32974.1 mechanosensitive ion channel [Acidithiobacillus caldus]MBU2729583.1 mechanosensitive ion channel [Acidithiobacillus caldus]MBU2734930.1 mechanosensitive ion channel [Acidithiobacillus caldus ATCC 51756]
MSSFWSTLPVDSQWVLMHLAYSVVLLALGVLVSRFLNGIFAKLFVLLESRRRVSRAYLAILRRVTGWFLWLLVAVVLLRLWGLDVSAIWTTFVSMLAVIGVGLLAVWTMVSNVTARFFIWFWRPLQMGQRIEIFPEGLSGEVIEENLMFTELRQEDGRVVVIPNNLFFQRVVRREPLEDKS